MYVHRCMYFMKILTHYSTFYSKNFSKSNISLNTPIMLISVLCKDICANFSGFSVGFCINEEKVICYQL